MASSSTAQEIARVPDGYISARTPARSSSEPEPNRASSKGILRPFDAPHVPAVAWIAPRRSEGRVPLAP
jgi:hypothetical protein